MRIQTGLRSATFLQYAVTIVVPSNLSKNGTQYFATPNEAKALVQEARNEVLLEDDSKGIRYVAYAYRVPGVAPDRLTSNDLLSVAGDTDLVLPQHRAMFATGGIPMVIVIPVAIGGLLLIRALLRR